MNRLLFLVKEEGPEYGGEAGDGPGARRAQRVSDSGSPVGVPAGEARPCAQAAVPDPFADADALEALEEEVVTLAAHIHAATYRFLSLIAEFDRRRGWELGGHRSAAHWLSFRTGIDLGAAREKIRAARALEGLPETSAAMARGEISFSKVRALTRVANAENEKDLVELARGVTSAQLERMVRAFRRCTRKEEADLDRIRHERRCLSVFPDEDGMYVLRGRLPAEVGALLMRAVEAASDALFREEGTAREQTGGAAAEVAPFPRPCVDSEKRAAQRRADALGLLAERAMAAGFEKGPVSGTRAARYQVVLHVEPETLEAPTGPLPEERMPGRSELEDGTRVSAETSRRISCDCGVVRVTHAARGGIPGNRGGIGPGNPDGNAPGGPDEDGPRLPNRKGPGDPDRSGPVLSVGRRTRTIPPAIRRALEVRDRGCRFPGCGSRFTDAHHVEHWADGGETSLENCLLLCRHHHRLVHEGGWKVDWWGQDRPVFFDPRGGTHFEGRWQAPEEAEKVSRGLGAAKKAPLRSRSAVPPTDAARGPKEPAPRPRVSAETSIRHIGSGGAPSGALRGDLPSGAIPPHPLAEDLPAGGIPSGALVDHLLAENRRRGIHPDGRTPSARWKREADIPHAVLFRAGEALLG